VSFREIAVTIRAVNHASAEFSRIQADAQTLATRMKTLGATIAGIGTSGAVIGYVANQFGLLNDAQAKVFSSAMMVVSAMGMFMRTSASVAIAQKVYSAATAFAATVQNSLNISFATFLALTGVGIAVIIAAAAAMYSFANSMNNATASIQNFNDATTQMPTGTRSIQRAGEAQLYRRGVE